MAHIGFLERNSDNEKISRKEIIDQIPVFCFINIKYAKDIVFTALKKKNPKIRVDKIKQCYIQLLHLSLQTTYSGLFQKSVDRFL